MVAKERIDLVAPCGIDCGNCELYICRDDKNLFNYLLSKGIPEDKLPCLGCRDLKGACPVINGTCETYKCVDNKKVKYCFECNDFPCDMLNPAADRAGILPHNTKVFNLCVIERHGVDEFVKRSSEIKRKYYTGKMVIGAGPK